MFICTQEGDKYLNANAVNAFYIDSSYDGRYIIFANVGDYNNTFVLGKFKNYEKAKVVMKAIVIAKMNGEEIYSIPLDDGE